VWSRTGRIARHRVTLVIAALLVGGAIGAGTTAAIVGGDNDTGATHSDSRGNVHKGGHQGGDGHGNGPRGHERR
jgi:hypothetical protein